MSPTRQALHSTRRAFGQALFGPTSRWVLRRPPLHGLTPSAHDMAREYRVVAALADTPVPVARAVTMRNDDSVLGAPFQMVEYVPGRVVRYSDQLAEIAWCIFFPWIRMSDTVTYRPELTKMPESELTR